MLMLFKRSKSIREFIESAKHSPEKGGFFWSIEAVKLCQGYSSMLLQADSVARTHIIANGIISAKIQAATSEIQDNCSGVRLDQGYIDSLAAEGLSLKDSEIDAWIKRVDFEKADNFRESIKLRLLKKNPLDLATTPNDLFFAGISGANSTRAYFNGKWYFGADLKKLYLALSLSACDFGFPCDSRRFEVRFTCSQYALCFDSYESLVRAYADSNDPKDFPQILRFRAEITAALRSESTGNFFPDEKSPP